MSQRKEERNEENEKQDRLEALGLLASSIAHDLNNILTGILGHVSFLKQGQAVGDSVDSLRAVEDGARRAAGISQKILDFAKGKTKTNTAVNLVDAINSAVALLRNEIGAEVNVQVCLSEESIWVAIDETDLGQIIINLLINARDALRNGAGNIQLNAGYVLGGLKSEPNQANRHVVFEIRDDGDGIPADLQSEIFKPFFTTKDSKGTGLGLAIVGTLVELYGGEISCESEVGRGTCFRVALPAAESEQAASKVPERLSLLQQAASRSKDLAEKARILVVDDEEAVRTIVQRSLEHLGYEVVVAKNGMEALSSFASMPGDFSLVIIDMIMPHMSGDQLYVKLKEIDQAVPVLIASGYSSDARTRSILDHGGLGYIQKPFAVEDLAREVRRCLDIGKAARG